MNMKNTEETVYISLLYSCISTSNSCEMFSQFDVSFSDATNYTPPSLQVFFIIFGIIKKLVLKKSGLSTGEMVKKRVGIYMYKFHNTIIKQVCWLSD